LLHPFPDPDTIGHELGWGSPEQLEAFADADAALGVVLKAIRKAGIAKTSVVIVSADHGGHGRGHSQGTPEEHANSLDCLGQRRQGHF